MLANHLTCVIEAQEPADLRRLAEHLPDEAAPFVSKNAVALARQRVGEAPMAWPFEQTARAWTTQGAAHPAFKGLSLWAMDGTTLRVPDSAANREHFGAQGYASGKVASYPQVRPVTLTAIPTHRVAGIKSASLRSPRSSVGIRGGVGDMRTREGMAGYHSAARLPCCNAFAAWRFSWIAARCVDWE